MIFGFNAFNFGRQNNLKNITNNTDNHLIQIHTIIIIITII